MAKLVQGDLEIEFDIVDSVKVSGGAPKFVFVETIDGLPKPLKLGNTPREWNFTIEPMTSIKVETLKEMFYNGEVCQFVLDDDSYNVVITSLSITDMAEYLDVSIHLREVDIDKVIEVG